MNSQLHSEIRQIAEHQCTTTEPYARTAWIAGFHAFAELVARLHKQNATTAAAWIEANTRRRPAFMNTFDEQSMLDQAIADHDAIAERSRRAAQFHHEQAAARAFASDPYLLQNQLDARDGKYTIAPDSGTNTSIWQDRFGAWHGRG